MAGNVPVIRYKNRTGKDNPVSGAIQVIPIQFDDIANSETAAYQWSPPAGMKFEIEAIDARCTAHTSDCEITVGTSAAGTQIVNATNLTTTLGALTLQSTEIAAGDVLDVRVVADAGDDAESVSITVVGHVSVPPDSLYLRGSGHF